MKRMPCSPKRSELIEKWCECQRCINNYKNTKKFAQPNDKTVDDAVRNGLTPGEKPKFKKSILFLAGIAIVNGDQQAVVLESIVGDKFIFKQKQIKMAVDAEEAPVELFFLHIDYTPTRWTRSKKIY